MGSGATYESTGIITNETKLQVGDGATPEIFTDIAEVVSIEPPANDAPPIDISHLLSPKREKRIGLADPGEASCLLNFLFGNTGQKQLEDDQKSGTIRNYRIMYRPEPPETAYKNGHEFGAGVKQFKIETIELDAPLRATVTFSVTGDITRVELP